LLADWLAKAEIEGFGWLEMLANYLISLVPRGGLPQAIFFNELAASATRNFPARSLGFLARVSHRFALASLNLTKSLERRAFKNRESKTRASSATFGHIEGGKR
jgi:hypothetical protein